MDKLGRGRQEAGPVTGQGKGLAEGGDVNQLIAPCGSAEQLVGSGAPWNEAVVGFIQDQGDVAALRKGIQFGQQIGAG